MIGALLAERFQLQEHQESRSMQVYALILAGKGNGKLKESAADASPILTMTGNSSIKITTKKGSIDQLVRQLSGNLDRPVMDATGLTATYDYELEWTPSNSSATDATAPSIFTALQEQLGLKLESRQAPIQVWVIDRAEKPSGN
jgi:uncharacterized protein (TIGR03435 family)